MIIFSNKNDVKKFMRPSTFFHLKRRFAPFGLRERERMGEREIERYGGVDSV